jgi:gluconokinase
MDGMNSEVVPDVALPKRPCRLVVMGVSGCGKTTVAEWLAEALHWPCIEGDRHHPQPNIDKMSAGIPLTDEDRAGWLEVLSRFVGESAQRDEGLVLTCSSLKRAYRDRFRQADPHVRFVHLVGTREDIAPRLALRTGHYMPPSLLDSQFRDLEPPGTDESAIALSVQLDPAEIGRMVLQQLAPTHAPH